MIVYDYIHRIAPNDLIRAGGTGVCRYLSYPSSLGKVIGKAEYAELKAAGIAVTLNWEWQADDWMGGAAKGSMHAVEAIKQARALGYPAGSVIIGSADFDMTRAQWNAAGYPYARAFAQALIGGGYRPGVYGPWDVLEWCKTSGIMDAFWQAGMSTAWSGGRNRNAWPSAHLRQRGHVYVAGQDVDWSDVLITPLWGSPPVPEGKEMSGRIAAVKQLDGKTKWYYGNGLRYRMILTWPEHDSAMADGAVEKAFDLAHEDTADWKSHVGRLEDVDATGGGVNITQDMINAAIAANVDKLADALMARAKELRIEVS